MPGNTCFIVCILLMSIRSDQYIITFSLADRSMICNGWKYILFVYTNNEQTWGYSFRFTLCINVCTHDNSSTDLLWRVTTYSV